MSSRGDFIPVPAFAAPRRAARRIGCSVIAFYVARIIVLGRKAAKKFHGTMLDVTDMAAPPVPVNTYVPGSDLPLRETDKICDPVGSQGDEYPPFTRCLQRTEQRQRATVICTVLF